MLEPPPRAWSQFQMRPLLPQNRNHSRLLPPRGSDGCSNAHLGQHQTCPHSSGADMRRPLSKIVKVRVTHSSDTTYSMHVMQKTPFIHNNNYCAHTINCFMYFVSKMTQTCTYNSTWMSNWMFTWESSVCSSIGYSSSYFIWNISNSPAVISFSPTSMSFSDKGVVAYLVFFQKCRLLFLVTRLRGWYRSASLRLGTGTRRPVFPTCFTKFLVAAANMTVVHQSLSIRHCIFSFKVVWIGVGTGCGNIATSLKLNEKQRCCLGLSNQIINNKVAVSWSVCSLPYV